MTLTDAFEKVFILTLPGAGERRAVLEGHLREVGIVDLGRVTWVRAVAGSVCPPPIWFRAGEGAWGCFCSHVRMAQDAAMDGVGAYFAIERPNSRLAQNPRSPRSNRNHPAAYNKRTYKRTYKRRHRIENFFEKLKRTYRTATRYDKLAATFSSFIFLSIAPVFFFLETSVQSSASA
jgi:hypothetical protein